MGHPLGELKVKIPALSLQKAQGPGRGIHVKTSGSALSLCVPDRPALWDNHDI